MPSKDNIYTEAASWLTRVENGSLSELERARFKRWLKSSQWNRIAFDRVSIVWHGAPKAADFELEEASATGVQFTWHYTDAWRDAVLPLALTSQLLDETKFTTSAADLLPRQTPSSSLAWVAAPPIFL